MQGLELLKGLEGRVSLCISIDFLIKIITLTSSVRSNVAI